MSEAAPTPASAGAEPTPVVTPSDASRRHPAGTAASDSGPAAMVSKAQATVTQTTAERPEVLVGAAFGGGLVAGLILKRLGR